MTIGKSETLAFTLKPITGTLAITTDPDEVMIYVDGEKKGESPLYIRNLMIGEHQVKLQKDSYATITKTVSITEKQTTTLTETLTNTKTITLTSNPSGASVYFGSTYKGTTPLDLALAYGKTYTVTLKKGGYYEKTINLSTNSSNRTVVLDSKNSVTIQGKTYKTVTIGNQTWLAENLNAYIEGSVCYGNNSSNCAKYGRLYTWEQAKRIADQIPGWHLPTDEEWDELCKALGGTKDSDGDYPNIGTKLKEGGSSGFEALLAGNSVSAGNFYALGLNGLFWSSSPHGSSRAWYRYVSASRSRVNRYYTYRTRLFSLRLVKDG